MRDSGFDHWVDMSNYGPCARKGHLDSYLHVSHTTVQNLVHLANPWMVAKAYTVTANIAAYVTMYAIYRPPDPNPYVTRRDSDPT